MKQQISIFSFFSGVGFLDLGFESNGYNVVYVNEFNKAFLEAYQYARQRLGIAKPQYGYFQDDINLLLSEPLKAEVAALVKNEMDKGNIVGFIGGPPCPDFSVGGKNRGHSGDHGKLTASYFQLICEQKPDFFLFENVKGLWKTKKHRAFYENMKSLAKAEGYLTTERLINSIEYGAPQDRERIIMLGFNSARFDKLGLKTVIEKLRENKFPWENEILYPVPAVFDIPWPNRSDFVENGIVDKPIDVLEPLSVEYWFVRNDVEHHPNSNHCYQPRAGKQRFDTVAEGDDSKKSYKRLHRWRYSPTACYGNNEVHLHPYKARRLNVAETLAIQSLPKDFEIKPTLTLSNMFKTIGNGVPFLAASAIAKTIKNFLEKGDVVEPDKVDR